MLKKITAAAFILIISFPALAQDREYQPGIKTIYNKPKIPAPTTPEKPEIKRLGDVEARSGQPPKREKETSPAERVWNKYKDLAAGTSEKARTKEAEKESEGNKTPAPPPTVEKDDGKKAPKPEKTAEPPLNKTPMQNLLEHYRENKDQQRQMRSRTYPTPKTIPGAEQIENLK